MKFTGAVLFGLGLFVASCSAACSCDAKDQTCMDKCATNNCIANCKGAGDPCNKSCISSNWPSIQVTQKDVLADTSTGTASATGTAEVASVSVYSTTLSGGSVTIVTSTLSRPSMSASGTGRASSLPSPKQNNNSPNTSAAASSRQILSAVAMVTVVATVATWML